MNCREFESKWNEVLDSRAGMPPELEWRLDEHAVTCDHCRSVSESYRLLRRAILGRRRTRLTPLVSTEPSDPVSVPCVSPRLTWRRTRTWPRGWSSIAAAIAFAIAWQSGGHRESTNGPKQLEPMTTSRDGSARPLGVALAEATEATIDLALSTSAPASRIGRDMIDLGIINARTPDEIALDEDTVDPSNDTASLPANVFRAVGERVGAGVKPLSGSARHAFSFLFGLPGEATPSPNGRRDAL